MEEQKEKIVALAWAQKKRHIAVDGEVLCEPKHTNKIRQRGEGGYNSLTINGIPKDPKQYEDEDYPGGGGSHYGGVIPFKPLDEIGGIIQRSICKQCIKKYNKLFLK